MPDAPALGRGVVLHRRLEPELDVMGDVYTEVERLSGRRVLAFISNCRVGPDLEIELFGLEPSAV